jgi:hypothetical protein
MLAERTDNGAITILDANVDRPVEQLLLDLERQAGRGLTVLPGGQARAQVLQ